MKNMLILLAIVFLIFSNLSPVFAADEVLQFYFVDQGESTVSEIISKTKTSSDYPDLYNQGSESSYFTSSYSEDNVASAFTLFNNTAWVAAGNGKKIEMDISNETEANTKGPGINGSAKAEIELKSQAKELKCVNGVLIVSDKTETNVNLYSNSYDDPYASVKELNAENHVRHESNIENGELKTAGNIQNVFEGKIVAKTKHGYTKSNVSTVQSSNFNNGQTINSDMIVKMNASAINGQQYRSQISVINTNSN